LNFLRDLGGRVAESRSLRGSSFAPVPGLHGSPQPLRPKTGVLFLNSPESPGADTFIHRLVIRGLDRLSFDVHAACSTGPAGSKKPALELLSAIPDVHLRLSNFGPTLTGLSKAQQIGRILRGFLPALASFAGLAAYTRRHGISIVHATDRPRDAVSCVLLARLTGAKSVVHVHVKCAEWMGRPVRWAMGQADALVGVSEFVAQSLVDNGYSAQKTHAVLNAIDPAGWDYRFDPGPVRHELGISACAPVIVCAARLFRGKGQDDVIRALGVIRQEFPDVRLLIVGTDDRQAMPTSFTAELKGLVADLGLAEHVIFTGQRTDMPALIAACDVFALPSFEEPFGLVYVEAMAMKKPVIALNIGGAREVVEHGRSGLLSAPGDQAGLAENLLALLRDPALRARMGEYGRQQVEHRFTIERLARDIEKVYGLLATSATRDEFTVGYRVGSRLR
jgi:glycosyltransferase involved in cell wall biosynthesis